MPFQPINFLQAETPGNPGLRDFVDNLVKGYQAGQVPAAMKRKAQEEELANAWNQLRNQEQPQKFKSEMLKDALTSEETRLKNQFYPDYIRSQIASNNALSKMRESGGGTSGLGAGGKEELFFQQLVGKDNPQLNNDPNKIYEAANVLRQGGDTLSDGTKINPLSPAARSAYDRVVKYGTTSPTITSGIQGNQAEAEMPVFKKVIDEGIAPYGTTGPGEISAAQISDALNVEDHAAQKRLGKYLAAQQLLYDRAALSLRINALPPGVTLADEIKKLSYASVNAKFPRLSAEARQIASDIVAETLTKALEARRSVQTGASSIIKNSQSSAKKAPRTFNLSTGGYE